MLDSLSLFLIQTRPIWQALLNKSCDIFASSPPGSVAVIYMFLHSTKATRILYHNNGSEGGGGDARVKRKPQNHTDVWNKWNTLSFEVTKERQWSVSCLRLRSQLKVGISLRQNWRNVHDFSLAQISEHFWRTQLVNQNIFFFIILLAYWSSVSSKKFNKLTKGSLKAERIILFKGIAVWYWCLQLLVQIQIKHTNEGLYHLVSIWF